MRKTKRKKRMELNQCAGCGRREMRESGRRQWCDGEQACSPNNEFQMYPASWNVINSRFDARAGQRSKGRTI